MAGKNASSASNTRFVKEPNTVEATDWHHDLPFWPMRGNQILSVWVALTDVGPENSALEYIAGSHKWGKFYAAARRSPRATLAQTPTGTRAPPP